VSYVYADHLNTARVIVRPSDQAILWTWASTEPFGQTLAANPNSATLGAYTYNPRFPGQVFDVEAGWFYNGHRDYNPALGRYAESDPLGLGSGSMSSYGYVDGGPLARHDFSGLQSIPGSTVDVGTAASLGNYSWATQYNPFATSAASLPDPVVEKNWSDMLSGYMNVTAALSGLGELSALRLLFLRPNPAALEAMNSALLRRMAANTHSVDCSEIAEKLLNSANRGEVLRMSPIKRFGSINVEENGQVLPFDYHEVYSDGNFVFDPRLSPQPVRLSDWYNQARQLNPGGVNIGPK
jgi:RHS repeat-associated protein